MSCSRREEWQLRFQATQLHTDALFPLRALLDSGIQAHKTSLRTLQSMHMCSTSLLKMHRNGVSGSWRVGDSELQGSVREGKELTPCFADVMTQIAQDGMLLMHLLSNLMGYCSRI